ncbi:MAG: arginine--tRNA ligase [bacterium]|nr:arginine--tRNA ligase [bacterium]
MKHNIEKILKRAGLQGVVLFVPKHESHGHYSTNIAMRLAGKSRRPAETTGVGTPPEASGKLPMELAKDFVKNIKKEDKDGFFERIEVAPPGFINFWLAKEILQKEFGNVYKKIKDYGCNSLGDGKTVIVEYSQPNIGKMMHVGHLRTTIIGDALANIYEFLGYKVVRWNYLGDWGTQFGKLIAAYKRWGNEKKIKENPIDELQALYVRFHEEIKKSPELDRDGQEEFRKLEEGDKENRKLWEWFKNESLKELEKIYGTLGVKFDTYIGESFFEKEMKPLAEELTKKGIAEKSEGALVIPLEKAGLPPALIQKADGASLYLSRDIANLRYRLEKYKPAKILYVVANEQSLHFEQLFAVAKILGLNKTELVHVKYGLVLGEAGTKLATREGKTILLKDALEKAISFAREIVEQKNQELNKKEKDEIANAVGVGALKYNDLKENRNSDIIFDWKKMLSLSGDSAPYLQYTYARLKSILRKAGKFSVSESQFSKLSGEEELQLMRKIFEFPDEVAQSAENLSTSNLANYLYKLAALVSRLYETTPIIKESDESRRNALLALIDSTASVLKSGLGLLGIKTPEKI